eukprot:TRINITY_DN2951_c0_g4_i1.p1 TRINITY_DN2951_c0_g4~~TRINITY_DN2951_c0_g4_i1.p1  ORF type:complete len:1137 (-),score=384.94 TRINITY_DN2951_c0_g4_i1:568-3978(-)
MASVSVRVIEARNLSSQSSIGKPAPFCVVTHGSQSKKTRSAKKTLSPLWSEDDFVFDIECDEIEIEIFDLGVLKQKRMGRAKLSLAEIPAGPDVDLWLPLTRVKDTDAVSGEVRVVVSVVNEVPSGRVSPRSPAPSVDERVFDAIRNNDVETLRLCVREDGFDINAADADGYTPLHAACASSHSDFDLLEILLLHNDVNVNVLNRDQNTPLHYFCAKFAAATAQDAFELFVRKHADLNAQNIFGETPLHKAVLNNAVRILLTESLIQYRADCNRQTDKRGHTPLHYAVELGRDDLVLTLLRGGARTDIVGGQGNMTPFELALSQGHDTIIYCLQRAHDLNVWLKEQDLQEFALFFFKHDLYFDVLPTINDSKLQKMGIDNPGVRLRIRKAIRKLSHNTSNDGEVKLLRLSVSFSSTPPLRRSLTLQEQLATMDHVGGVNFIDHSQLEYTHKLGSGTSGVVYKGLYRRVEVAIKVLKADPSNKKEVEEFKKEFAIMSALQDDAARKAIARTNLASSVGSHSSSSSLSPVGHHSVFGGSSGSLGGTSDGGTIWLYGAVTEPKLCMVMEFCSRGSLFHVLRDNLNIIDWDRFFSFALQFTGGLNRLHTNKPQILHRDFKSLNIMVTEGWNAKVADFGTARFNTAHHRESLLKSTIGTFAYLAPEVYNGDKFTTKADVFSLGIVLWELLHRVIYGRYMRPYGDVKKVSSPFAQVMQTAQNNLRPTMPPTCPKGLATLITMCWHRNTDIRPDCSEVLEELLKQRDDWDNNRSVWDGCIVAPSSPEAQRHAAREPGTAMWTNGTSTWTGRNAPRLRTSSNGATDLPARASSPGPKDAPVLSSSPAAADALRRSNGGSRRGRREPRAGWGSPDRGAGPAAAVDAASPTLLVHPPSDVGGPTTLGIPAATVSPKRPPGHSSPVVPPGVVPTTHVPSTAPIVPSRPEVPRAARGIHAGGFAGPRSPNGPHGGHGPMGVSPLSRTGAFDIRSTVDMSPPPAALSYFRRSKMGLEKSQSAPVGPQASVPIDIRRSSAHLPESSDVYNASPDDFDVVRTGSDEDILAQLQTIPTQRDDSSPHSDASPGSDAGGPVLSGMSHPDAFAAREEFLRARAQARRKTSRDHPDLADYLPDITTDEGYWQLMSM